MTWSFVGDFSPDGLLTVAISAAIAGLAALAGWRLLRRPPLPNLERIRSFSMEAYRPLARILSTADIVFLRSRPGFGTAAERRFRRSRHRIFVRYLDAVVRDFEDTRSALLYLDSHSATPIPGLHWQLLGLDTRLRFQLIGLRLRGWAFRAGWDLDIAPPARALDCLLTAQKQLRLMIPAAEAA